MGIGALLSHAPEMAAYLDVAVGIVGIDIAEP